MNQNSQGETRAGVDVRQLAPSWPRPVWGALGSQLGAGKGGG